MWGEREYDDMDNHGVEDSEAINALYYYRLLKNFTTLNP
jgi:hypothetical protein